MIVYITAMTAGFFSFITDAPELVTDRKSLNLGDKDIAMNIGRIAMVFHLFTSIPLSLLPCKN